MRPSHIIILIVVLVLIFGARRLPDVARSIGQSLKVFKKEVNELQEPAPAVGPAAPAVTAERPAASDPPPPASPPPAGPNPPAV
ncbi:MAG: twin-arginine translocase TatA/TatE family subunit [Propionibacteriaceae bacterium]|nr:twin-arginine translocase TatA/TatE family subunit [Propionibacteriaceae bacterium]